MTFSCEWCRKAPVQPGGPLCPGCWAHTAAELDALPKLLADLRQSIARQAPTAHTEGTTRSKAGPRSVAREEVIDVCAALCVTLCRWGGPAAGVVRTGPAGAVRAAQWLRRNMRLGLNRPAAVSYAIALEHHAHTARTILGDGPTRVTPPCPRCDTRGLVQYGSGVIWCTYCQTEIAPTQYRDHCRRLITACEQ